MADVVADVRGELRVDLVQHILAVIQRPHLTDGLIPDPGDDPGEVVEHGVHREAFGVPVLAAAGELGAGGAALARLGIDVGHALLRARIVGHVVDARPRVDDGAEGGVGGHVGDLLAVDPHRAPVANRIPVLVARSDHCDTLSRIAVNVSRN
jgi:hypothetical protein